LKINDNYANRYNTWRGKEEYQKLKDKYGDAAAMQMLNDGGEESSSTSESEDEGDDWTPDKERDFFRTLSSLVSKDPSIYDSSKQFFNRDKEEQLVKKKKTPKEESITLRDYERKVLLDQLDDEEDNTATTSSARTYHEEQAMNKEDLKNLIPDSDSDTEDVLTARKKTKQEQEKEDVEFKEWLKGKKDNVDEDTKSRLKPLKDFWSNPKLDENEKFLKDFILNERYKEKEDDYIPTYDEIVHDSDGGLSEDEKTLEQQAEFEHKFNFRFEEPDAEYIKKYPRTIANSLRRQDDSRRLKREDLKERKQREKDQKKEDLKQLKKFKLKEIQDKLEQLRAITGNPTLPFQDEDLDEDFDPDQHDAQMSKAFDDDYYGVDEGDQKPEFPYDEELDNENWDEYAGQDQAGPSTSHSNWEDQPHCEDANFNMDCDYDPNQANMDEMIDMSRSRKSRRKSVFAKKLESKKPTFNPEEHPNYEEYLEEYYKLDYEDIIGDLPVRFKYRQVVANDFGLDTEEILAARDKELNRWCSVKKTCQYRPEHEEMQDVYTFKTKKGNFDLKKKLMPSLFNENPEELLIEDQEVARKKRRKNKGKDDLPEEEPLFKKTKRSGAADAADEADEADEAVEATSSEPPMTSAKVAKKAEPLVAAAAAASTDLNQDEQTGHETTKKKKKKRKNKNALLSGNDCADQAASEEVSKVSQSSQSPQKTKHDKKTKNPAAFKKPREAAAVSADFRSEMTDERLKAYGFNPKKVRNQIKYGKSSQS